MNKCKCRLKRSCQKSRVNDFKTIDFTWDTVNNSSLVLQGMYTNLLYVKRVKSSNLLSFLLASNNIHVRVSTK